MPRSIASHRYKEFRREQKFRWMLTNEPCGICGQRTINYLGEKNLPDSFELDHIISRKRAALMGRPELDLDPQNVQPAHHRCNRNKGAGDAVASLGELDEEY
jgi:5-methylcytosine-specific restriction endonuclease McrA